MPNFIDVMDRVFYCEQKLDEIQKLLTIMVKDIHMINMILIKGEDKCLTS